MPMNSLRNNAGWLLDERLAQSQKLAAIGELSAGIAHEINHPLAIIRQEAEWMQHLLNKEVMSAEEAQELQGSLRQVVQQVDRCGEIIHNLLDFARKREPVLQDLDLNRLIEAYGPPGGAGGEAQQHRHHHGKSSLSAFQPTAGAGCVSRVFCSRRF